MADSAGATLVLIVLWYLSSIVCTNLSKQLSVHWCFLTLAQCLVAASCNLVIIRVLGVIPYRPATGPGQLRSTVLLSVAFCGGFITLNSALRNMSVSLVMTMRALEPLFTAALAAVAMAVPLTGRTMLGLAPVVIGAGLSAANSVDCTAMGLATIFLCNCCFAARGVLTKQIKAAHAVDDFNLFFQICTIGSAVQGALLIGLVLAGLEGVLPATERLTSPPFLGLVALNGVAFFAYLQLSWVVLSRVDAVTHSVCNSLRRPVMCVFGWLQFGNPITPLNAFGIGLACAGALFYGHLKRGASAPSNKRD